MLNGENDDFVSRFADGSLLVCDDFAGLIYRISYGE